MTRASRFLAALDACLPAERFQHGRVTRAAETVQDTDGGIGFPWRAEGTLGRLQRKGEISPTQLLAGEQFKEWFELAQLDPLRAADMRRSHGGMVQTGVHVEHARRRVGSAIKACGGLTSPCGSCVWHVLGLEDSLAQWAKAQGWAGRTIRHESAKYILVGGLSVLAVHYGIERG